MPNALISVTDKSQLVEFAQELVTLGWVIWASGGTSNELRKNSITVNELSDYTGMGEMLGGRVKTLHPAIYAGILARDIHEDEKVLANNNWLRFDLVVVNLYPFEKKVQSPNIDLSEAIENIDIGGVALLRAAAKNFQRVLVVCDPADYSVVIDALKSGQNTETLRRSLAWKAFGVTSRYDAFIAGFLSSGEVYPLNLYRCQNLRYGENPHQQAIFYSFSPNEKPFDGRVLQGKELSYNNILDVDAGWRVVSSFDEPTVAIIKHLSPCGIASANTVAEAYRQALECDPVSAFGGIVASNRVIDETAAIQMKDLFIECIVSPGFTSEAMEILSRKKNCRVIEIPISTQYSNEQWELRSVYHGVLRQSVDWGDPHGTEWRVVTSKHPDQEQMVALKFAWKACQHVKSNAIVLAKGKSTVGIGGGQPNRVQSVRIAIENAGERARGAVMASDAFFPFPDSIEVAAKAGIGAIIQPGGSVRDNDVIRAADNSGIAMIFTGVRHFKH
ncbi:bifunctional phosphoribosylaminoimidazolecarboxamide formyltransferase/IMP cyclohydrolase [Anaerolinea thermophila]|uniref:Bifunctional purine biosynthesis protein PurH n=1 Tax=Anaerolinea thermophila (strain DSM 14523 / JCM 11388 / NBRC 100420 / UNI-1) TaxID=926569 RepID=E8N558_ANATU|nr:bifunctional phosphoribosylaminoimidazolecarboxamide formyltransferase/IMP cyclohydrolase [Anaerolinea thermophila]BAJ63572.1 phosphoribosylaminoimidazolecarboxamide formyltransferase/IMP cyclohydrolase [Anaerolinea thermophila UNI-1]